MVRFEVMESFHGTPQFLEGGEDQGDTVLDLGIWVKLHPSLLCAYQTSGQMLDIVAALNFAESARIQALTHHMQLCF